MTLKRFNVLFALAFVSSVSASDLVETNVGGGLKLKVPSDSVEKAQSSFIMMRDNLKGCKDTFTEYLDPIIGKTNTLIVSKSRSGVCQVTWIKDSLWQYTCEAPSLGRKKWLSIFSDRVKEERYFGDFSEYEQSILFDDKSCMVKRQR
jgi:hypothetical protein